MKQLSEAINDSISDSEQVGKVITRIKAAGYDIYVVLEATVGFNKREEEAAAAPAARPGAPELRISPPGCALSQVAAHIRRTQK